MDFEKPLFYTIGKFEMEFVLGCIVFKVKLFTVYKECNFRSHVLPHKLGNIVFIFICVTYT